MTGHANANHMLSSKRAEQHSLPDGAVTKATAAMLTSDRGEIGTNTQLGQDIFQKQLGR